LLANDQSVVLTATWKLRVQYSVSRPLALWSHLADCRWFMDLGPCAQASVTAAEKGMT